MASADRVKEELQALLATADLDSATTKSLRKELEAKLGEDMEAYKTLIKEEIDRFMDGDEEEANEEDWTPDDEPQTAAGKRKAESAFLDDSLYSVALSAKRRARVRKYNGQLLVDIREFVTNKDGEVVPTGKGLALDAAQFDALQAAAPDACAALKQEDTGYDVPLSGSRKLRVHEYSGRVMVDLREFYEKEGEQLPGKKGIALNAEEWSALCDALHALADAVKQHGDSNAMARKKAKTEASDAAGPKETALKEMGDKLPYIELSSKRRADVSEWQGRKMVNIREYYEKNGELLPSSKGIALPWDQFQALVEAAPALNAALLEGNTSFEVALSGKRKAQITSFKGTLFANIREFYIKNGDELPGKKGISLPMEQWEKLYAALPILQERMG